DCDFPGFGTIGTGSYLADSALYGYEQHPAKELITTIYNTLSAKFLAESASDVGKQTYLYVFGETGDKVEMGDTGSLEHKLREMWLAHGKPPIPKDMADVIRE